MVLRKVDNPPNRFHGQQIEWYEQAPDVEVEIYEECARSIISSNTSPDLGFRYSINPYRGCFHACAYCYARPTHQYIDFGVGTDFDRKLVAKVNAAELLRAEFDKKSWQGELLVFSGVTDCYQPLESHYRLTRACLEVCALYKNPVAIITKSALVRRDIDLLRQLNEESSVQVTFSLATFDAKKVQLLEPHAPRPAARLRAMKELADAGISVGVAVAPIIPAWNDSDLPETLRQAAEAGASHAWMTLLRLPQEVEVVFRKRLQAAAPDRASHCLSALREMRGGALNDSRFGSRLQGTGARWDAIRWLFTSTCERLGLSCGRDEFVGEPQEFRSRFTRPNPQLSLW